MKRFLLVLVLWLNCAVLFAAYPYDSICEIRVRGSGGSATLIAVSKDKALLLTCKHVVEYAGNKIKVHWAATGEKSEGKVVRVGRNGFDIAVCICPRPNGLLPVPVTGPSRKTSGRITNAGYPGLSGTLEWQTGKILDIYPDEITVSCRPVPGMSGGATFDQYGNVIGIIVRYGRREGYSTSGTDMLHFVSQFMASAEAAWSTGTVGDTDKITVPPAEDSLLAPEDWDEYLDHIWMKYREPKLYQQFLRSHDGM